MEYNKFKRIMKEVDLIKQGDYSRSSKANQIKDIFKRNDIRFEDSQILDYVEIPLEGFVSGPAVELKDLLYLDDALTVAISYINKEEPAKALNVIKSLQTNLRKNL